jgi:hypothetical protein
MYQSEIVHLVGGFIEMEDFKIIDAEQAKLINSFKNAKHKLLKTNYAFWFNITHRQQLRMAFGFYETGTLFSL